MQNINRVIPPHKLKLIKIDVYSEPGDCLYAAIIKGANSDFSVNDLRNHVARVITLDKDLYDDLITEWIDFKVIEKNTNITPHDAAFRIQHLKEWGTSTIIHILANSLNLKISVVTSINDKYFVEQFPSDFKKKQYLNNPKQIYLYANGYHFDLLEEHPFGNIILFF